MAAKRKRWKDESTGKVYELADPRFVGSGNPPTMPRSAGAGREVLEEVETTKAPEKPGKNPYNKKSEQDRGEPPIEVL